MSDPVITDEVRLQLLRKLEANPNLSQRELAASMGVSLGKVNFCIKALAQVGWIKAGNFARSKNKVGYAYLITAKGIAEKAALTTRFIEYKQKQYDSLRQEIEQLKREVGQ